MNVNSDFHGLALFSPEKISHHALYQRLDWFERGGPKVLAFNSKQRAEN
jgi:hypothetical protein